MRVDRGRGNTDATSDGAQGDSIVAARFVEDQPSDSASRNPAPARITLGSDAYSYVRTALAGRLADLEAQKDLAFSTDFPAGA